MDNDSTTTKPSLDALTFYNIARHYCHAKSKHPYFAESILPKQKNEYWRKILYFKRKYLKYVIAKKLVSSLEILECETAEACDALARGDNAAAVEECYDCIAVLLRIIDVLEGRQALGKPKAAESGAE